MIHGKAWQTLAIAGLAAAAFIVQACAPSAGRGRQPAAPEGRAAVPRPDWADPAADWPSRTSPVTLTVYADSPGFGDWDDPITRRIAEKTGVSLQLTLPVQQEESESVALFMASNQFPDLLCLFSRNESIMPLLFQKKLACMDDLMGQYAPRMRAMIEEEHGAELLTDFLAPDKKVYGLFYGYYTGKALKDLGHWDLTIPMSMQAWLVREDYFKEIGSPDTSTPERFIAAFKRMKQNHPDKIGLISTIIPPAFGMGFWNGWIIHEDGSITHDGRDPRYKRMMEFYNELYRAGVLTKDAFINSWDVNWAKWLNGDVIGISGQFQDGFGGNGQGLNPIPAAGTRMLALPPFGSFSFQAAYWADGVALIPEAGKHKDRALLFLDYLASKEGQVDAFYGVPGPAGGSCADPAAGPHFWFDARNPTELFPQGKPTLYPDVAQRMADPAFVRSSGLGRHQLMRNWRLSYWPIPALSGRQERLEEYQRMMKGKVELSKDLLFYVDPLKEESVIQDKINLLREEYETKELMAAGPREVDALVDEFLQKAIGMGLEKVEKEFAAAYARRKANTSLIPGA
jgi:putative aldouronate transport system substrate-binding protein